MKKDPKVKQAESEMVVVKKSGLARTKVIFFIFGKIMGVGAHTEMCTLCLCPWLSLSVGVSVIILL